MPWGCVTHHPICGKATKSRQQQLRDVCCVFRAHSSFSLAQIKLRTPRLWCNDTSMTAFRSLLRALLLVNVLLPTRAVQARRERELSTWTSAFYGRGKSIPAPSAECQVCFFEKPNFAGDRVCIGERLEGTGSCGTEVLPIAAPSTIGSIQFTPTAAAQNGVAAECILVANIRVLEPPYGQRIETFASDVAVTGFDNVVQEIFVEKSGTACFLAAKQVDQFGKCYNASVDKVEDPYRDAFYEVLLFKQLVADFDVIAYEGAHFNTNKCGNSSTATAKPQLSKRFTTSSGDLTVDLGEPVITIPNLLQYKINSIEFVRPGAPAPATSGV